jgi:DGQHR domain-containing protein
MFQLYSKSEAFGYINAEHVHHLSVTSILDNDKESPSKQGMQRMLTKSRVPQIAKFYLRNGNRQHVTPIVVWCRVSSDDIETFSDLFINRDWAGIKTVFGPHAMTILDGQHRQAGLMMAFDEAGGKFNPAVPLQMFFDLTYDEAAQIFLDINDNGKNVAGATRETIRFRITKRNDVDHDQWARKMSVVLDEDPGSAWYKEFDLVGKGTNGHGKKKLPYQPGFLTMAGVPRGLKALVPSTTTLRYLKAGGHDVDSIVMYYWNCIREVTGDAWEWYPKKGKGRNVEHSKTRLRDIAGFGALCFLGSKIIDDAVRDASKYDLDLTVAIRKALEPLKEVDWRIDNNNPWLHGVGAGWAGSTPLYHRLKDFCIQGIHPDQELKAA